METSRIDTIFEGDNVVIERVFDSGNMKIISVTRGTIIHYGKLHFDPSPLIGKPYGSVLEIRDATMLPVEDFDEFDNEISAIVSNKMATFNDKSQFSQEKLIKKKKRSNYANIVSVIKPSLRLINEMLYARDKVGGLRADSLAQIITSSNVQNGSKILLLDHNLGLVTAAVISRCLPFGKCIQLIPDNELIATTRSTLDMLNIKKDQYSESLFAITIRDIYKVVKNRDNFLRENDILKARGDEQLERIAELSIRSKKDAQTGEKVRTDSLTESERRDLHPTLLRRDTNREQRNLERMRAAELLKARKLDSIILICQYDHPLPLLKLVYEFLSPSGQIVIYCDIVEPLLECYEHLKKNNLAVSLAISESWLRRFQVLPDRTRPDMNTSGIGGYILNATKVIIDTVDRR